MTAKESKAVAWPKAIWCPHTRQLSPLWDEQSEVSAISWHKGHAYEYTVMVNQSALHAAEAELTACKALLLDCADPVEWASEVAYSEFSQYAKSNEYDAILNRIRQLLASDGGADGDNEGEGK